MRNDTKNIIKIASVYTGTVLGAGFASGQEIKQFFLVYGYKSLYGIILSSVLFALMGAIILNKIYKYKIKNYGEYINPLIGRQLGWIAEILVTLFLMASFNVMVAGSGAVFYEEFGLNKNTGIIVMLLLCLFVFLNDIKGVVNVNTVLTPIMIVAIVFLGCYVLIFRDTSVMLHFPFIQRVTNNYFFSAILYVSYNTLTIIVIMTALLPLLSNKKTAVCGGAFGGVALGVIAFLIWTVMFLFYNEIMPYEIPMLHVVLQKGRVAELVYVFVLYSAMFTTAVSSGYGFLNRVCDIFKINKKIGAILFCIISIPCAYVGFENLVKNLYSLFGYMGLFMMMVVLADGLKELF